MRKGENMKKDAKAKKRDRIINTIMVALILATIIIPIGTVVHNPESRLVQLATKMEERKGNLVDIKEVEKVTIEINTKAPTLPEYKEITDEETGEKVMAQVQVNEPIEPKSTTPPEKPVSKGDYTNPDAPPTYTKEQTKVEQPKKTVNNSTSSSSGGKVYVEGFGYVEKAGKTQVQTGVSDGDINKMIGSMD